MPCRGIHNQSPFDDLATLDHLRTRLDGARYEPNMSNEERTVLCCWKCNNVRGTLTQLVTEELSLVIDEEHSAYPMLASG